MVTEGSKVAYAGDDPFNEPGSIGRVLSMSGSAAHVMWQNGPKDGIVDLVEHHELVPARSATALASTTVASAFDNSLSMTGSGISVRATYDDEGAEGLLTVLSDQGRLAVLAEAAEQAYQHVASAVRTDADLSAVLAELDPDEAAGLVTQCASMLLAERLSEEGID